MKTNEEELLKYIPLMILYIAISGSIVFLVSLLAIGLESASRFYMTLGVSMNLVAFIAGIIWIYKM